MKKRLISTLLILSMTAAMAAGCSGKESSSDSNTGGTGGASSDTTASDDSADGEDGSITFMAPDWAIPTDDQLKAFTDETGIEVTVNEVGWDDIRDKMVTAAAG